MPKDNKMWASISCNYINNGKNVTSTDVEIGNNNESCISRFKGKLTKDESDRILSNNRQMGLLKDLQIERASKSHKSK